MKDDTTLQVTKQFQIFSNIQLVLKFWQSSAKLRLFLPSYNQHQTAPHDHQQQSVARTVVDGRVVQSSANDNIQ